MPCSAATTQVTMSGSKVGYAGYIHDIQPDSQAYALSAPSNTVTIAGNQRMPMVTAHSSRSQLTEHPFVPPVPSQLPHLARQHDASTSVGTHFATGSTDTTRLSVSTSPAIEQGSITQHRPVVVQNSQEVTTTDNQHEAKELSVEKSEN